MSNERKLESLFDAVLAIESQADRAVFLDRECKGDSALRREIEQMLNADREADGPLDRPPVEADHTISNSVLKNLSQQLDAVPRVLLRDGREPDSILKIKTLNLPTAHGRYQLFGEMARGGMGAIVKGRDTDLGRDLVLKVLLGAHENDPESVRRFVEEAQIGGQLQHPGIVPVYELGQLEDQRPFFTMKLVKGKTLAAILSERVNVTADRGKLIGVFEQVCQTVAYAHSKGVIHRDLKPANIMIGSFGEVQVMDWGLAKVLSEGGTSDERKSLQKHTEKTIIQTLRSSGSDTGDVAGSDTRYGSVMGTFAYMPPEQAMGDVECLDERVDVFALGAILAEILTDSPPYVAEDARELHRLALRGETGPCLARLEACEADPELTALAKACLSADYKERPKDASAVAGRVAEFQAGLAQRLRDAEFEKVVTATQVTEEKRRRKLLVAISTLLVIFAIAAGITAQGFREVSQEKEQQRQDAQAALDLSRSLRLVSSAAYRRSRPLTSLLFAVEAAGQSRKAKARLHPTIHESLFNAAATVAGQPLQGHQEGDFEALVMNPQGTALATSSSDGTVRLWELSERNPGVLRHALIGHQGKVTAMAFSPDGDRLATAGQDGTVRLWTLTASDPSQGALVLVGNPGKAVWPILKFSPQGELLLAEGPLVPGEPPKHTLHLWEITAADPSATLRVIQEHTDHVLDGAFTPDGRWLYTGARDRMLYAWDLSQDELLFPAWEKRFPGYVVNVKIHGAGNLLATGAWGGETSLWQIDADGSLTVQQTKSSSSTTFSRGGKWWVTNKSRTGQVILADLDDDAPEPREQVLEVGDLTSVVGFSPDDRWLCTSGGAAAQIWDLEAEVATSKRFANGHDGPTRWVMSPDVRWLVSLSTADRTARLWDLSRELPGESILRLPGSEVALSPDGRQLATSDRSRLWLWDLTDEGPVRHAVEFREDVRAFTFGAENRRLFTGDAEGTVRVWDLRTGAKAPVMTLENDLQRARSLAVSLDGRWLAGVFGVERLGSVRLWDLRHAASPKRYQLDQLATHIAFARNSRWLFTGKIYHFETQETSKLWDLSQETPLRHPLELPGQSERFVLHDCRLSGNGRWLITGSESGDLRAYDLDAKDPLATEVVRAGEQPVRAVAISANGKTVWSNRWSPNASVELWKLPAPEAVKLLYPLDGALSAAFSRDGSWLAAGTADGSVHLWDLTLADHRQISLSHMVLQGHDDEVQSVTFTADDQWLVSSSADGTTRVWPLNLETLLHLSRQLAGRRLTKQEIFHVYGKAQETGSHPVAEQ